MLMAQIGYISGGPPQDMGQDFADSSSQFY